MNKKKLNKEDLEIAVRNSKTYVGVFRFLQLCPTNYKFLKEKLKEYNIDTSHFNQSESRKGKVKKTLDELLQLNSVTCMSNFKIKLYNAGLKQRACEECGQIEEWRNKKMSLILDHINGNRYDNRLENLRILCPNCNAIQDTHCGKNKRGISEKQKQLVAQKNLKIAKLKEQYGDKVNSILNSDIDFTKHGWRLELAEFLKCTPQNAGRIVKNNIPELWERCKKHKT